ncbi:MAG: dUTP diphosphatase [Candidatus Hadarchaeia archaeon]
MDNGKVVFEKIKENAIIPSKQHENDVGYDIFSIEDDTLKSGDIKLIGTGLKMSLPKNLEAQIRPRSGLALSGVIVPNSPGTIDPGYRGELKVILGNIGSEEIKIEKGDRIAQLIFSKIAHPELSEGKVEETERGENGFGSTGK